MVKVEKVEVSFRAPMTITGNAIHAETIKKELRNFHLNEQFLLSPTAIKSTRPINIRYGPDEQTEQYCDSQIGWQR